MDANFGLVHKRTAGIQDLSSARHTENPYMHDQTDVDKFLASYRESKNEVFIFFCILNYHKTANSSSTVENLQIRCQFHEAS